MQDARDYITHKEKQKEALERHTKRGFGGSLGAFQTSRGGPFIVNRTAAGRFKRGVKNGLLLPTPHTPRHTRHTHTHHHPIHLQPRREGGASPRRGRRRRPMVVNSAIALNLCSGCSRAYLSTLHCGHVPPPLLTPSSLHAGTGQLLGVQGRVPSLGVWTFCLSPRESSKQASRLDSTAPVDQHTTPLALSRPLSNTKL